MVVALPALGTDALSGILGSLNNISFGDIASQLAIGALATTAVAGAQTSTGQNALDPLHIFHKDGSQTVINPSGKTISAAALKALDPATQSQIIQQGYQVVG